MDIRFEEEFTNIQAKIVPVSTDIFKEHVWEDWNIYPYIQLKTFFKSLIGSNGYFNALQCKLMFRSSHFWFFAFGHFWRPSYKDTKILHNLCLHIARQDGQHGKNNNMQLKWPKYQKPRDKNVGWIKEQTLTQIFFSSCLFISNCWQIFN